MIGIVLPGWFSEGVYSHISKLVGPVVEEVTSLIVPTALCLYGLFCHKVIFAMFVWSVLPQSDPCIPKIT